MSGERSETNASLAYIKAMSGEEEVRHIELSPEEGKALLERLQEQSRLRRGSYTTRSGRQFRRAQDIEPVTFTPTHSITR